MSEVVGIDADAVSANEARFEGQEVPFMSEQYIKSVSDRYIELYEKITGENFVKADTTNIDQRIKENVLNYLDRM